MSPQTYEEHVKLSLLSIHFYLRDRKSLELEKDTTTVFNNGKSLK